MDSGQKPALSDYELAQRLCTGNEEEREAAMGELMHRYWRIVHAIGYDILHSTDAARDVAQTTFVTVLEQACRIKPDQSFGGWIRVVARNEGINITRRYGRFLAFDEETDPTAVMWTASPASPFDQTLHDEMVRKIDALPLPLKVVAEPVLVDGEKVADVAARRGLTAQGVYARLEKARKHLGRSRSRQR